MNKLPTHEFSLLKAREAADLLGLSVATLAAWRVRRSDGPPHIKVGGAVRYDRAELMA
ncbi:helix-turn-helix domain-containing protein [Pacificispira sp.]|uniref:helix-turn-helix domain-containing protein n=1 Tax=Pacificispira sp. TaxID=2888761 RepID=UPI003BAD9F24